MSLRICRHLLNRSTHTHTNYSLHAQSDDDYPIRQQLTRQFVHASGPLRIDGKRMREEGRLHVLVDAGEVGVAAIDRRAHVEHRMTTVAERHKAARTAQRHVLYARVGADGVFTCADRVSETSISESGKSSTSLNLLTSLARRAHWSAGDNTLVDVFARAALVVEAVANVATKRRRKSHP